MAKKTKKLTVEALKHDEATGKNIPTAEYQSVMQKNEQDPVWRDHGAAQPFSNSNEKPANSPGN